MKCYKADAISRKNIRDFVHMLKKEVGLEHTLYFPILPFVDKFVPSVEGFVEQHSEGGVKYDFEGERYIVKCNKVAGYLRIFDKQAKSYCLLDGTPSKDQLLTHFKIKRREEM